ncbi:MAG: FGGY-family carbohydrate kinase, partial [Candidatus Limnocylindria bacterium]
PAVAGTPAGRVGRALPEAEGALLTVSGHDHLCASVGAGAIRPGDVFDSCGTAEALVRPLQSPLPAEALRRAVAAGVTVGWHVVPDQQAMLAGFFSGLALERFQRLLGVTEEGRAELDAAALAVPPGADGVTVRDVTAERASVEGIPARATPAHVWRATLEALAGRGAELLTTIESVAGATERLVVTGGWARDPAVRAVKREVFGPFEEPDVEEAGARGAALIAGISAGTYRTVSDLPPLLGKGL